MNWKSILKIVALNLGLLLINVAVFSKGILGFSIFSANVLVQAASITIPLLSAGVFAVGNYRLLRQAGAPPEVPEDVMRLLGNIRQEAKPEDIRQALHTFEKSRPSLRKEIAQAIGSMDSIDRKQEKMERLFVQSENDLVLAREELDTTETIICSNLKRMMNTLIIWDPAEEKDVDKAYIYDAHRNYIEKVLDMNDKLLDKADELLVEVVHYIDAKGSGTDMQDVGLSSTTDALRTLNGRASKMIKIPEEQGT